MKFKRKMCQARQLPQASLIALSTGLFPGIAAAQESGHLSGYGLPGYVDMPSAYSLPDGTLALSGSVVGKGVRRGNMVFQITPRLTGVFRYAYFENYFRSLNESLYDRSFDMRFRLLDENPSGWRPAVTVGLQDFGGTGIYGAEYVVASKRFGERATASAGIGWGRLGSAGSFRNPLSVITDRFDFRPGMSGIQDTGKVAFDRFFRGPAAIFWGFDWQATDRTRLSVEYSSDAMRDETRLLRYDYRTPVNVGIDYRWSERMTLKAGVMHGAIVTLGFASLINPARPYALSGREGAPPAVSPGQRASLTEWRNTLGPERLAAAVEGQGARLIGAGVSQSQASLAVENRQWHHPAAAWGRTLRGATAELPAEVSRIELQSYVKGMPVSSIALTRTDLEELEYAPDGAWKIWSRAEVQDALRFGRPAMVSAPSFTWGLMPYAEPAFFDPDEALRIDVGVQLQAEWSPLQGVYLSGGLRQKLLGNLSGSTRESDSVLTHVRSDAAQYAKGSHARIPWLTAEHFWRPAADLYSRVTFGLLEGAYGGLSTELLWAPQGQRYAFALELNKVRKRGYKGHFAFQDYQVTTGHASAWYEFDGGYTGQVDVGRYLAADYGGTFSLRRRFGNGFEIGAFFTLTDVGFTRFGEGAFDKGITFSIPLTWITGRPAAEALPMSIRPIMRDGGARVHVRNRLYDVTRPLRKAAEGDGWGRFWR